MTPVPDPETEELLRCWAGAILVGARGAGSPPPAAPDRVASFARFHGLTAYIGEQAGPESMGAVRDARNDTVALEMARRREFTQSYQGLAAAVRRPPLIFKGQALAHTLYPAPWYRPRCDTDVLLDAPDIGAAVGSLEALGYRPDTSTAGDLIMTQRTLRKKATGVDHSWDLHWQLTNRPELAGVLSHAELLEQADDVRLDPVVFKVPGRVHSLLIACLHLAAHHLAEPRLIWLYDIHLLAGSLNDGQYEAFRGRAAATPAVRAACHGALALTQRYLPSAPVDALCRQLDPGPGGRLSFERRYAARLLEDLRAVGHGRRASFLRQHLFPPAAYMARRFNIRRRWQLPFWYALRIGRALPKLLRRH